MKQKLLQQQQFLEENGLEDTIRRALKIVVSATPKTDEQIDVIAFWHNVFENDKV